MATTRALKGLAAEINEVFALEPKLKTVGVKTEELEANVRAAIQQAEPALSEEDAIPGRVDEDGNVLPNFSKDAVATMAEMGVWPGKFEAPPVAKGKATKEPKAPKEPKVAKPKAEMVEIEGFPTSRAGSVRAILNRAIADGVATGSELIELLAKTKQIDASNAKAHVKAHVPHLVKGGHIKADAVDLKK